MRRILLIFAVLILSACTIGKDYQRPDVEKPNVWRFEEKEAKSVANTAWWEQFQDPVLNDLIRIALAENKDLLIAAAKVEEYMGRYGATRADQFPQASIKGTGENIRITESGYSSIPQGISPVYNNYQVSLNASWEIDLWGKYRRASEAARADLLSTEEGRRSVILTLVTSVAGGYVNLLNLDQQLDIARRTVKTREESLNLFKLRFEGGVISELELSQVKSEYEEARGYIPQFEKAIAQQENALSILLGRNPGLILRGRIMDQLTLPAVPEGLPSDLLERRPDIRQAEQNLIAANAQIGVAKAAYFPSISLTGFFGTASADLSNLFKESSKVWNWGGSVTLPIFTAGRTRGQVKAAESVRQQSLFNYQKAIQTAFREVEDALVDQLKSREKLDAQMHQVSALRTYKDLALMRYENGYSSYLEVLDAERNLFSVELAYVQTRGNQFQALVNLYKAMGGGWITATDEKRQAASGKK
ncbi:MAG: RND transporter [Deltaproteobacteria bacterium HGW-Deltaproteobacteria-9]|nr:MAG: RND transporter [Deltaproteobacteria bacterium HGW-Deltaproteobacteria-9]